MEYGAFEFVPDNRGRIPLDYAGEFKHEDIMVLLINKTWSRALNQMEYDDFPLYNKSDQKGINELGLEFYHCKQFIMSPVLHSNLLYWASALPDHKFNYGRLNLLLEQLVAYPEVKNYSDHEKCALHSAAIAGNSRKLKILLNDIN